MNSPFAKLYTKIQARIASNVPETKWTDFNLDQLNAFDGERPPVDWPCTLIDFVETTFQQMQGYQDGDVIVEFTLAWDEYLQTNSDTPEYVKEQALQYLELEHKYHLAFQGWNADGLLSNALIRVSATSEKRENDNLRVRRLVYKGTFSDGSVAL